MGKLLEPAAVAEHLGVKERTLTNWRYRRQGPPYRKLGDARNAPVRYDEDQLRTWLEGQSQGGG